MLVALKPIQDAVGIERINVCDLPVRVGHRQGGHRRAGKPDRALLNGKPIEPKVYPKQIAFNVLPHIDVFMDNGYTKEEMKMVWETRKIMEDESIQVNPTTVRVPVFYGHSEAVHIETRKKITAQQRASCWRTRRAWWSWTSASPVAIRPLPPRRRARTRYMWAASAKISRTRAAWICG